MSYYFLIVYEHVSLELTMSLSCDHGYWSLRGPCYDIVVTDFLFVEERLFIGEIFLLI